MLNTVLPSNNADDLVEITPTPPHVRGAVVWFGLGLTALLGLFMNVFAGSSVFGFLARATLFGGAVAAMLGGIALRQKVLRRHLRLGADGVVVRRGRKKAFFPWHTVIGLSYGVSHRMFLDTMEGPILIGTGSLRGHHLSPPVHAARPWAPRLEDKGAVPLGDIISAALAHYEETPARCEAVLEGVEPAEWENTLTEAVDFGDYRERRLTHNDLLTDLENPSLSPELRATLARVIRPKANEAGCLRSVLRSTAAPRVRVALEHTLAEMQHLQARATSVPAEVEAVPLDDVQAKVELDEYEA